MDEMAAIDHPQLQANPHFPPPITIKVEGLNDAEITVHANDDPQALAV